MQADRLRLPLGLHFSPRGEAKWVRGPSGRGARRLARAGVLESYVEHGKQAQRSPGGRIACFDRRVVRNTGQNLRRGTGQAPGLRDTRHGLSPAFNPSRQRAPAAPTPELLGFHESRDTKHESRSFIEPPPYRPPGFWVHETRNTRHESRLLSAFHPSRHGATALPASRVLRVTRHGITALISW